MLFMMLLLAAVRKRANLEVERGFPLTCRVIESQQWRKLRTGNAALAVHRLVQLGDLKLSFDFDGELRAATLRVGLGGPSPVFQRRLAGSGFQTLMA